MPEINPTGEQQQLAKLIDVRIQEKFDTLANWEKNNPVLLRGEMGFAALDINNEMKVGNIRVKIGDGTHTWNELGWGALGPTGVNIHMSKDPITTNPETLETYFEYSSLVSPTGDIKVGDVVIDHVGTKSDNLYEAGWDGEISFFKIVETNDAAKEARVEPWGETLTIKGKSGATGPTGANPAESKLIPNDAYLHDYRSAELCGWFYASTGNTVQNKPAQVDSFTLCVYRKGDNQYIHELYDQNNRVWIETYNGTQWTQWKEKAVGIASVSGSFDFTNKESSATNTGTIKVTLDDVSSTSFSHTYEVRNGIGITGVELVKPSSVQTTGSAKNTYTLKFHKSAGGNTDERQFDVYNGNGITAMQAVAVSTSDKDSGTSSYKIQYKHTADNSAAWHDITNGTFTVQNGQGLVKMDVTGALVSGGGQTSTFTLRAYYSDNQSTPVEIGTFQVQNGKDIASLTLTSTESTASGVRSVTYTLSAKYSDGSSGQAGTFTVKDGVGISAAKITGGGNTASSGKNTYTLTLTKTDGKTLASTFDVYNGAKGDTGDVGPTGPTGPTGSTPASAKQIPNGTDLNTYTYDKAGWYFAAGGNACPNKPSGVDAFGLEVLRSAQGWTVQICYPSNNSTNKMFIRNSNNGSWSAWQEKGLHGASGGVELYSYNVTFMSSEHKAVASFQVISSIDYNVHPTENDIISILNLSDVHDRGVACSGKVDTNGTVVWIQATPVDTCILYYQSGSNWNTYMTTDNIFDRDINEYMIVKSKLLGSQATLNNFSLSGNVLYINDITTKIS